jgi:hypothetical protein
LFLLDLIQINEDDFETPEALTQATTERHIIKTFETITSLTIDNEYTDDHLPCFDVTIETNIGTLHLNLSWLAKDGVKAVWNAEDGKFKRMIKWLDEYRQEVIEADNNK